MAMLREGEVQEGRCSLKERLKEGDAQCRIGLKRAMLIEGEA